jgi:tetratricopeptide (TPR) repeat protein
VNFVVHKLVRKLIALSSAVQRSAAPRVNNFVSSVTGQPLFGSALLMAIRNVKDPDEAYRLCEECLGAGLLNVQTISPLCPYVIELVQLTRSGQADGPRLWHCLGLVAESCNDHETARRLIEKAISADSSDISMRNSLGIALLRQGRANVACCTFSQAALLQPQSEAIRANLETSRSALRSSLKPVDPNIAHSSKAGRVQVLT